MASSPRRENPPVLPNAFPQDTVQPKFHIGDRVQWQPRPTRDFGTITGIQYALTPHSQTWNWQYTIWLDAGSPSFSWTFSDIAWETDLEAVSLLNDQQAVQEPDR